MIRPLVENPKAKLTKEGTKRLFSLIEQSERQDRGYFRFMAVLRDLVKGQHWKHLKQSAKDREQTKIVINLAHAHVRTMLPTLFFQHPSVKCYPMLPIHEGKDEVWEAITNSTLERIDFKDEVKEVTFDSIVYPEGVFKWIVNRPDVDTAEAGYRGPVPWLSMSAPGPVRLSPIQLIVDYLSTNRDLKQARFISIRYTKTLSELRHDPRYSIPKDWKPVDSTAKTAQDQRNDPFLLWDSGGDQVKKTTDFDELITIHEVWIKELVDDDKVMWHHEQMCVLMEGYDLPIRQLDSWENVMGKGFHDYPVTRLVLNPIPDSLPGSELGVQHSIQTAINWLVSRILGIVEQEKVVVAVDNQKLKYPKKIKKQLASGKPIEHIEVTEPQAFEMIQPTFVGRDNYQMVGMLQGFLQQISGVSQNRRGASGVRTATEASLIESGMQIKTDEKVDTQRTFLKRIVKQMMHIIHALVGELEEGQKYVVRLAGETGTIQWQDVAPEDLAWFPEVEIQVDSFRQRDQQQEVQRLMTAWQVCMQAKQMNEPVRMDILLKQVLEAMQVKDIGKMIFATQDEMLQQSMELVMMSLGQPAEVRPDDNHPVHRQAIQAFRNTPIFGQLDPEVQDAIEEHDARHEAAMAEQQKPQGSKLGLGTNPFESQNGQPMVPTEANIARQETQYDRQEQAEPGMGGQLR